MTAETVLLRVKRRGEQWMERPGVRESVRFTFFFGGALVLSGLELWGRMQPVAMGFAAACTGWRAFAAAAGGALGYVLFWGREGLQGVLWALGGLLLAVAVPLMHTGPGSRFRLALGCVCLVFGTGLGFGLAGASEGALLFLRAALAGGSLLLWESALGGKDSLSRWLGWGVGVMALAGMNVWLGCLAAGFAAAAAPLPAALAVALGAELGAGAVLNLTAGAALAFYLQRLLPRGTWRGFAAPGLALGILMLIRRDWEPGVLLTVILGACAGALVPWRLTAAPRRGSVGAAQVRLEQMAGIFTRFQRQLLEFMPPPADVPALTQKLKQYACGSCSARTGCLEQNRLNQELLTGEGDFRCRKEALANGELRRSREQLRQIRSARAKQEEYRMALVQQYGFLSDALRDLSDHLPDRRRDKLPRCRVQVSARSRGKELADGDRVSAFPGTGCRYYVLLCDGMGTGLGAAEESRQASELIRDMLTAGMTPGAVLGSINSQLTLMERGGAVTVDLAELRLDTGRVWLYKWGAGPSWLLRRRRQLRVGSSGPPPGLGVGAGRETVNRVVLFPGDTLVMLSDGVEGPEGKAWALGAKDMDPGALASRILAEGSHPEDDATAVVIRLLPHAPPEG